MLRLGRKYGFATFENVALERLHHDCPTKLLLWNSLEKDSRHRQIDFDDLGSDDVVAIAHEFRLFTTLPAAYVKYLQCRNLVTFFSHQSDFWFFAHYCSEQEGVVDSENLSEETRKRCILGYVRIQKFVKNKCVDALRPPLVLPSKTCYGGAKCEANAWKAIRNLRVWSIEDEDNDRFGIFCPWQSMNPEVKNLCLHCRSVVQILTDRVRAEFWLILPSFFDLPDWAALRDES
jgi:hypothetical protein